MKEKEQRLRMVPRAIPRNTALLKLVHGIAHGKILAFASRLSYI
jgi:hypothetical protein